MSPSVDSLFGGLASNLLEALAEVTKTKLQVRHVLGRSVGAFLGHSEQGIKISAGGLLTVLLLLLLLSLVLRQTKARRGRSQAGDLGLGLSLSLGTENGRLRGRSRSSKSGGLRARRLSAE